MSGLAMNVTELALLPGDLLDAVLVEHVAVGHLEGLGIAEVDLLLSPAPLALGELDGHPGRLHVVADRAHEALLLRGLQDVVVLEVVRDRREGVVPPGSRRVEGLPVEVELELGPGLDGETPPGRPLELAAQHPPGGLLDRRSVLAVAVAEHQRRSRQPRDQPPRGEVGHELHVSVAALPGREAKAGQRLHLHVDREEIDAGVHGIAEHVVEEVAADHPLAEQATQVIGKP